MDKAERERLAFLAAAVAPLPWGEDDGNVFSEPLADARFEAIRRKTEGRPYDALAIKFSDLPSVATTHQEPPETFEANAAYIVAACNAVPALLAALDEAEAKARDLDALGNAAFRDSLRLRDALRALVPIVAELDEKVGLIGSYGEALAKAREVLGDG